MASERGGSNQGNAVNLPWPALLPAATAAAAGDAAQQAQAVPRDPAMPLPLPWTSYFDRQERVVCPERRAEFNVYIAGDRVSGPDARSCASQS